MPTCASVSSAGARALKTSDAVNLARHPQRHDQAALSPGPRERVRRLAPQHPPQTVPVTGTSGRLGSARVSPG